MNASGSPIDPRPPLALRIGVTGSRCLHPEQMLRLRQPVARVLATLRDHVGRLAVEAPAVGAYAASACPTLHIISPLAEGADRLVAEEARALGYRLMAPLPFAREEYEKDFAPVTAGFDEFIKSAQVFALDGGRHANETASYEAAGRFVVRNCDLLIAIWDGQPARGRGGTEEIIRFAAGARVPIWWIDLTGIARLVLRSHDLLIHPAKRDGDAEAALLAYVEQIVLPPIAPGPDRHGPIGRLAHYAAQLTGRKEAPLQAYLNERVRRSSRGFGRIYEAVYGLLASKALRSSLSPSPAAGDAWWQRHYARADALSVCYGDLYRSSYVVIIILAFLALAVSALGSRIEVDGAPALAMFVELLLLLVIAGLVGLNYLGRWQERWITYRLLAELCRKQMVLAPLGRMLPGVEVTRSAAAAGGRHQAEPWREAWVSWYFLALQRAAPLPEGGAAAAVKRALAAARDLVDRQLDYHGRRQHRAHRAERRLNALGEMFFVLTVAGLTIGLVSHVAGTSVGKWIEASAIVISGASASFVGLRAYSEFGLLVRQSQRMEALMTEMKEEIEALDLEAPLASQRLGAVLHRLAMAMMQEVSGWVELFRLKSVETG